jgi:ATP-dependent Clp protease ATP-binding subunit ClpC
MNNFTPRAGQVLALSRREAEYFHHDYVGTEHLLLGLIRLGQGVAVDILKSIGLDHGAVRLEVEERVGKGNGTKPAIKIPFAPRVKKVVALAGKEAKMLGHDQVGTEHLLLGLLRDERCRAGRILTMHGVNIEETRIRIFEAFKDSSPAKTLRCSTLLKQVGKYQRLPILILSGITCVLLCFAAWYELVRN